MHAKTTTQVYDIGLMADGRNQEAVIGTANPENMLDIPQTTNVYEQIVPEEKTNPIDRFLTPLTEDKMIIVLGKSDSLQYSRI